MRPGSRTATLVAVALAALGLTACGGGGGGGSSTTAEPGPGPATSEAQPTAPAATTAATPATTAADPSTLPLEEPATLEAGTASVVLGQHDWSYVGADGVVAAEAAAARGACREWERVPAGTATVRVPLPATSLRAFALRQTAAGGQVELASAGGPELTLELPPRRLDLEVVAVGDGFTNNYRACMDARPAQAPTDTASPASTER